MNKAEVIKNMRRSGMSIDDICRSLNATTRNDRKYVTLVLRKSGMQETEEEKQISKQRQADGFKHSEEWVRRYILEKSHGAFEYVNGYINMDSHLFVRCVQCGRVEERAMGSFRSGNKPTCVPCKKKETEELMKPPGRRYLPPRPTAESVANLLTSAIVILILCLLLLII